jgi:hypothetical protein
VAAPATTHVRAPLPWRAIARWTVAGTLLVVVVVLLDVRRTGLHVANLIQPGEAGPSAEVVHADFPGLDIPDGTGHDGQQFYAVARAPMHLDEVSAQLDRPNYRLQRPLYPWLAWLLHPTGGGGGLVVAMLAVGVGALVGGGLATGALSASWGGPPWLAALFPVLPGSYVALRISTADSLALALAVGAVVLAERDRRWPAVAAAAGAVLAKEPMLAVLAGYALWRRDRLGALLTAVPAAAALAWAAVVRLATPSADPEIGEVTWPFAGFADSASKWVDRVDLWALAAVATALALAAAALAARGLRHPLGWAVLANAGLLVVLDADVVGLPLNAPRAATAPMLLAVLALATADRGRWAAPTRPAAG